ncbi:aspartate-semialdehyde dehydrogenase [Candidatus Harpocratesius sp.]
MSQDPKKKNSEYMKEKHFPVTITSDLEQKLNVAIIGCTGLVGQSIVEALINHPWFKISSLHGFGTVGKKYKYARRTTSSFSLPSEIGEMIVKSLDDIKKDEIDIIFSAVPSEFAAKLEPILARDYPVFSTASWARYKPEIPIFLPIVNGSHFEVFEIQKHIHDSQGFVCPGPNCTTVGLAIGLYPIFRKFGLESVNVVSMQAISGAGYAGVSAYDIIGNIIPYIPEEERKVNYEIKKIFAQINSIEFQGNKNNLSENSIFVYPKFKIDSKCNRVPVLEGHLLSVFFQTKIQCSELEIRQAFNEFNKNREKSSIGGLNLPNYPKEPIYLFSSSEKDRPQPRIDLADPSLGMITFIGGLGPTNFEKGFKMTILSHNTELGAGRGAVLNAEYLYAKGTIGRKS